MLLNSSKTISKVSYKSTLSNTFPENFPRHGGLVLKLLLQRWNLPIWAACMLSIPHLSHSLIHVHNTHAIVNQSAVLQQNKNTLTLATAKTNTMLDEPSITKNAPIDQGINVQSPEHHQSPLTILQLLLNYLTDFGPLIPLVNTTSSHFNYYNILQLHLNYFTDFGPHIPQVNTTSSYFNSYYTLQLYHKKLSHNDNKYKHIL